MVWCSACGTPVTIKLLCKALGVSAYLLNDSYESNKNKYDDEQCFQVFCKACHYKGLLLQKLIEKHPKYYQNLHNSKISQYNRTINDPKIAALNNTINQLRANIQKFKQQQQRINQLEQSLEILSYEVAETNQLRDEVKRLNYELFCLSRSNKQDEVASFYKKFQDFYKNDEIKMKALAACKHYSQQMSNKDAKFKLMLNDLFIEISKDSTLHLFKQIQNFSQEHMNLLDKKIKYYEQDIKKMQWTKDSTIDDCSRPSAACKEEKIMRPEKLLQIQRIFDEQIEKKKAMIKTLCDMQGESKINFIHDLGEITIMTDAEMHQKSRHFARILIEA